MNTYDFKALQAQFGNWDKSSHKAVSEANDFMLFEDISKVEIGKTPTRLHVALFGLCTGGKHQVMINSKLHTFEENDYIVLFPNQVVSLESKDPVNGIFFCLSNDTFESIMQRIQEMLSLFLYVRENPCQRLRPEDAKWIIQYYNLIFAELSTEGNIFRRETAKALAVGLFYKACNIYASKITSKFVTKNRQEEIFSLFIRELSKNYKTNREVTFYADRLCITPKYLSTTIKKVSGQSANQWIQSYVLQEAKVMLKTTHKSIQQISLELCFPSQSFFGKYFKQHVGISPQQYRKH